MIKTWRSWEALVNYAVKMFYNACPERWGAREETTAFIGWGEIEKLLCRLLARSLSFVSLATIETIFLKRLIRSTPVLN